MAVLLLNFLKQLVSELDILKRLVLFLLFRINSRSTFATFKQSPLTLVCFLLFFSHQSLNLLDQLLIFLLKKLNNVLMNFCLYVNEGLKLFFPFKVTGRLGELANLFSLANRDLIE